MQWTRVTGGESTQTFIAHVSRLLSLVAATAASIHSLARVATTGPKVPVGTISRAATPGIRRFALWIAGSLLILSLGYVGAQKFPWNQHTAPTLSAADTVGDKSVAVLPFADMSERKDQEYLSDGLAEELIEQLGRAAGLKVIARTSSFSFKGKSDDIATIAAKLKVAHILEGSVRRAGDHLRVSTQLIRAETGETLWSHTFDWQLKDLFAVQL